MSSQSTTIDMSEKFDRQYKLGEASALRELERAACGYDYGGRMGIGWEASGIASDIESAADDAVEAAMDHFEKSKTGN